MSDKNKYFEPKMHKQALQAECCRLHDQRDLARRDYECMNKLREHAEKHRNQLRQALETATNIIDKMGDMPDRKICPIVWRDLECEGAVDKARAALKATEE